MKSILFSLAISFFIFNLSCKNKKGFPQKETPLKTSSPFVVIKDETLFVEISDTERKREIGLMFRDKLAQNKGMLFIFENERVLSFWMKNTKIPLSIAFINSKDIIVDIQDMKPLTKNEHRARFPALYGLEVNQGWFKKHNIRVGDKVSFHY